MAAVKINVSCTTRLAEAPKFDPGMMLMDSEGNKYYITNVSIVPSSDPLLDEMLGLDGSDIFQEKADIVEKKGVVDPNKRWKL